MMLKTILFFLFGCSLYFGQRVANTGFSASQVNSECNNCGMNLNNNPEGDGTKATGTNGQGSGTTSDEVDLITKQVGNHLNIQLIPQWRSFTTFIIYDSYGNVKKEQQIQPTNSYSIDISDLASGDYSIDVEVVSPHTTITQSFIKQ